MTEESAKAVTLFFCKVKRMSELSIEKVRDLCKSRNIKVNKKDTKQDLCVQLGKNLFGAKVGRINNDDVVKFNNLKLL